MSTYFEIEGRKNLSFNQFSRDVSEGKIKNIFIDTSNEPTDNAICLIYKTPQNKAPQYWLWAFRSGKTIDFERYGANNPEPFFDAICAYYDINIVDEDDERYLGIESYDIADGKDLNFDQLISDIRKGKIKNIILDETPEAAQFINKDTVCLAYKTPKSEIPALWIVVNRSGTTVNFQRYGPTGSEIIMDEICAYYKLDYTDHCDD